MLSSDLCSALDRLGIEYATQGKNISHGWLGLQCPECGNDTGFHLGIEIKTLRCSCWRCSCRGPLYIILNKYYKVGWGEYKSLFIDESPALSDPEDDLEQRVRDLLKSPAQEPKTKPDEFGWPPNTYPIEKDNHLIRSFLKKRNYTFTEAQRHGCRYTNTGKLAHRLLIPIYKDGRMIGYQGRAMRSDMEPKYLGRGPINDTLYNIENIKQGEPLIVVEGIFDQWRVGDGCVASFGKKLSAEQRRMIARLKPSALYLVYDPDAFWQVEDEARKLVESGITVYKVDMLFAEGDPDELGRERVLDYCAVTKPML